MILPIKHKVDWKLLRQQNQTEINKDNIRKKAKYLTTTTKYEIKSFSLITKLPYEKNRPKHEPTLRYFHLLRQLANFMMRSDKLNRHDHSSYTEMTALSSNINVMDEDESK